jgi:DNA-binding transcriptional regulator YiaG
VILNVSVDDLRRWAEGKSYPPAEVLRRLATLARRPDTAPVRRLA